MKKTLLFAIVVASFSCCGKKEVVVPQNVIVQDTINENVGKLYLIVNNKTNIDKQVVLEMSNVEDELWTNYAMEINGSANPNTTDTIYIGEFIPNFYYFGNYEPRKYAKKMILGGRKNYIRYNIESSQEFLDLF